MHILITNDDGYSAPGIKVLARELARVADISVVAPDRNKSGASNSLTLTRPLRVERFTGRQLLRRRDTDRLCSPGALGFARHFTGHGGFRY